MAEKKKVKSNPKTQAAKKRLLKMSLFLGGMALILTAVFCFFWFAVRIMFSENPHFTVKRIEVNSSGWWSGRGRLVSKLLRIELDRDNLFALNLGELRRQMEKQSSVESVAIERKLPDTLVIDVSERIPRAFLKNSRSKWVVDSSGVVMNRMTCIRLDSRLPAILGFDLKKDIHAGEDIPELMPALDLIMTTIKHFPEFKITAVSIRKQEKLTFFLVYNDDQTRPYKVFIPRRRIKFMLTVLRSAIIKARQAGDMRRTIDLTFRGNAVLR